MILAGIGAEAINVGWQIKPALFTTEKEKMVSEKQNNLEGNGSSCDEFDDYYYYYDVWSAFGSCRGC